ncbi:MAG: DUF2357 domain-containing protein [Clostridium sp.]
MGMQVTGYSETELIVIESEAHEFLISISGKFGNYKAEKLNHKEVEAKIKVDGDLTVKTINENGVLEENKTEKMTPIFFEDGVYDITFECSKNYNIIQMEKPINLIKKSKKYPIREGKIQFKSDIGFSKLVIKDKEKIIGSIIIEVFPTKINYKEDYKTLLQEVNENMEALAFDMFDKTYLSAKIKNKKKINIEFLSILKAIFEELEKSLFRITRNFKHNIEKVEYVENIDKSRRVSKKSIGYLRTHQNILENHEKGFLAYGSEKYIPSKIITLNKKTTIDIWENRYVKYAIKSIIYKLSNIEEILKKRDKEEIYLGFIREKKGVLNKILRTKFDGVSNLNYVKEITLVFQISPGYKEFYKNYILLRRGLDFSNGIMEITPKKMYKLYEIWCYIKLHNMIKEFGFNTTKTDIIKTTNNGLVVNLTQGKEARVSYKKGKKSIELWYNKSYDKLPTTVQRPDVVLIIKEEGEAERIYIFDAKYRVRADKNKISVEEKDINVMHRYRDSIVAYVQEIKQFKYETFGAYVMFPYENEIDFIEDKYYKSIEKVNIGAFPMLPKENNLIYKHLGKILNENIKDAHRRRVVTEISVSTIKTELEVKEIEENSNVKV